MLCGPSGSGKSTLMKLLMAEFGSCLCFSVSHTTRQPRPGEQDGVDYHFVTREQIGKLIETGEFIEHTEFSGNLYGTSRSAVRNVLESGRICILDIETTGVRAIKKTELKPRLVFLTPPSLKELEARLKARGTETEDSLAKRLGAAKGEMEYGMKAGNFHVVIVNDMIERAYKELREFVLPDIEKLTR